VCVFLPELSASIGGVRTASNSHGRAISGAAPNSRLSSVPGTDINREDPPLAYRSTFNFRLVEPVAHAHVTAHLAAGIKDCRSSEIVAAFVEFAAAKVAVSLTVACRVRQQAQGDGCPRPKAQRLRAALASLARHGERVFHRLMRLRDLARSQVGIAQVGLAIATAAGSISPQSYMPRHLAAKILVIVPALRAPH
jgi:hypothetical protein